MNSNRRAPQPPFAESTTGRDLVPKQEASLDRIEQRDPEARVIGWSDAFRGPIVELSNGDHKILPPTGYLRKER